MGDNQDIIIVTALNIKTKNLTNQCVLCALEICKFIE